MGSLVVDNCIEFTGNIKDGYGRYSYGPNRGKRAHRVAWEEVNGVIPEGMFVCHKCDNPPCINIDHLFLGTPLDNMRDMIQKGRKVSGNAFKTHCTRGHEYTEMNTRLYRGSRHCRECERLRSINRYAESKCG